MKYDDAYETCVSTYASLRLFSDGVDPDSLTAILNLVPTTSFRKGEPYGNHGHVRKFNGWLLLISSEHFIDSKDSRRHIDWILERIGNKSQELTGLRSKGVEIDISCLWLSKGQGGPTISPQQMTELARLGIDVWWDVYFDNSQTRTS